MKYDVWTEGYRCSGNSETAQHHGAFEANSFVDAVKAFRDTVKDDHSRSCIDIENMNYWGCRFFDNENDARKSFG